MDKGRLYRNPKTSASPQRKRAPGATRAAAAPKKHRTTKTVPATKKAASVQPPQGWTIEEAAPLFAHAPLAYQTDETGQSERPLLIQDVRGWREPTPSEVADFIHRHPLGVHVIPPETISHAMPVNHSAFALFAELHQLRPHRHPEGSRERQQAYERQRAVLSFLASAPIATDGAAFLSIDLLANWAAGHGDIAAPPAIVQACLLRRIREFLARRDWRNERVAYRPFAMTSAWRAYLSKEGEAAKAALLEQAGIPEFRPYFAPSKGPARNPPARRKRPAKDASPKRRAAA